MASVMVMSDSSIANENDKEKILEVEERAASSEAVPLKFQDKEPLELIQYIENIILSVPVPREEGKFKTIVIPGSAVENVDITQNDQSIKPPERKQIEKLSTADLQLKKTKLLSWLEKNRIVLKEEGDAIHFWDVILLPPYEDKDICTTNPVVALEIKKLIAKMPADYVAT